MDEITIEELGSRGDGVGTLNGATVYVAGALPGETVIIEGEPPRPTLVEIVHPSAVRQLPPCPHFARCGGCSLQHLEHQAVLDWKRAQVGKAFRFEGIAIDPAACIAVPDRSRRRVTFSARRVDGELLLGFQERSSHALVDIDTCIVALPQITAMLDLLRRLAAVALARQSDARLAVTWCDNGPDVALQCDRDLSDEEMAALVRIASGTEILRLSHNGDVLFEYGQPVVTFDDIAVNLPPGTFLQAVEASEEAMATLVCKHLAKAKRVADLFSGCGTFGLRLARHAQVHAVETDEAALEALVSASGKAGLKRVTGERRDLHQLPVSARELEGFNGLCLDPPRAGADEQCREIARSSITRVAYVSCNPATLARDSAVLIGGGYRLEQVVPIDQFVHSNHVEAVALFSRSREKSKRSIFR